VYYAHDLDVTSLSTTGRGKAPFRIQIAKILGRGKAGRRHLIFDAPLPLTVGACLELLALHVAALDPERLDARADDEQRDRDGEADDRDGEEAGECVERDGQDEAGREHP